MNQIIDIPSEQSVDNSSMTKESLTEQYSSLQRDLREKSDTINDSHTEQLHDLLTALEDGYARWTESEDKIRQLENDLSNERERNPGLLQDVADRLGPTRHAIAEIDTARYVEGWNLSGSFNLAPLRVVSEEAPSPIAGRIEQLHCNTWKFEPFFEESWRKRLKVRAEWIFFCDNVINNASMKQDAELKWTILVGATPCIHIQILEDKIEASWSKDIESKFKKEAIPTINLLLLSVIRFTVSTTVKLENTDLPVSSVQVCQLLKPGKLRLEKYSVDYRPRKKIQCRYKIAKVGLEGFEFLQPVPKLQKWFTNCLVEESEFEMRGFGGDINYAGNENDLLPSLVLTGNPNDFQTGFDKEACTIGLMKENVELCLFSKEKENEGELLPSFASPDKFTLNLNR